MVCLSQPSDNHELSHLINVWMPVGDLVKVSRTNSLLIAFCRLTEITVWFGGSKKILHLSQ